MNCTEVTVTGFWREEGRGKKMKNDTNIRTKIRFFSSPCQSA